MAHLKDLSDRSLNKGIFTFSNFLNEDEIHSLIKNKRTFTDFTLFGGAEGTSRNMVRFGNEDELYYSEDFPIDTIKIEPLNAKFAEELSHRDYLGAIMNLSVERELIGERIRHTDVKCSLCEFRDNDALYKTEEKTFISSSLRADCVICAVFDISRSNAEQLFDGKKVFINSATVENNSKLLRENDTVSVRGFGKFIYCNTISETKKGRLKILIKLYC